MYETTADVSLVALMDPKTVEMPLCLSLPARCPVCAMQASLQHTICKAPNLDTTQMSLARLPFCLPQPVLYHNLLSWSCA